MLSVCLCWSVDPLVSLILLSIEVFSSFLTGAILNPESANYDCSRRHPSIFFHCFSEKIRLDASSESSARQRIHMKNQALFSLKGKSKKLKCRLLQFLFGALRVKGKTLSLHV